MLATVGAVDLTVARAVEPHLDALSILKEAGVSAEDDLDVADEATWGVFAAESSTSGVSASFSDGQWRLVGTKAWCSLAGSLSHALVTATTSSATRRLFAVSLTQDSVVVRDGEWHARGLTAITSGSVDFNGAFARPIGADGWYLERPGFAWGGIGVAACWWGGAVGIARRAISASREREPDQIGLMQIGALDLAIQSSRLALAAAADAVDGDDLDRDAARIVGYRTRARVARDVDDVIERVGHALGPAPLALEEEHARRVADLQLYVRQHHAERDYASLGRKLLADGHFAW
ncbi:acyl-CoA dehydrogenase family protein [Salinibacterium sp. SWN1162]|uniref:acyl-CoA dehydrogenase family protein n=1 Tax=Salinibacterium sp. SWN1162 TaxID=2792053 RepID=UPI0018CE3FA1|nr:acyl-CoA dehydrogenase family protein [Salinibacterium sp. SWN1162]MBH0007750.1 acyl-CoA/acyl-ACP dehydrogenase [Salinibacterium sp. SWN1162]